MMRLSPPPSSRRSRPPTRPLRPSLPRRRRRQAVGRRSQQRRRDPGPRKPCPPHATRLDRLCCGAGPPADPAVSQSAGKSDVGRCWSDVSGTKRSQILELQTYLGQHRTKIGRHRSPEIPGQLIEHPETREHTTTQQFAHTRAPTDGQTGPNVTRRGFAKSRLRRVPLRRRRRPDDAHATHVRAQGTPDLCRDKRVRAQVEKALGHHTRHTCICCAHDHATQHSRKHCTCAIFTIGLSQGIYACSSCSWYPLSS